MEYVAVDLGGTNVRVALAGEDARPHHRRQEPTALAGGPVGVADQIARLTEQALSDAGVHISDIRRMVVGSPGPIDEERGLVLCPPNLTGWGTEPLGPRLNERLGLPVLLVNDASAAALGEFTYGAGRGVRNLVYVTVSTGIGGGVVTDGRLLRGASGNAAEIGHMVIDVHGPRCGCGSPGCLEAFASGTGIARRFHELVRAGQRSVLAGRPDDEPATAEEIARAAEKGDDLALSVLTWAFEALGVGISNCVNLYNPEVVTIGGGVTAVGPLLFETVRLVVDRLSLPTGRRDARIVPAELGSDSGLVGAAALAAQLDSRYQARTLPPAHQ